MAFDGVGGAVGRGALELVGPGGRFVMHGWAAGTAVELSAADLFELGVTVVPAVGAAFAPTPAELRELAVEAIGLGAAGVWRPVHTAYALDEVADAHRAVEAGATIGKVVLVP